MLAKETLSETDETSSGVALPKQHFITRWCPPIAPSMKCNSDVAFDSASGKGIMGIVCRNYCGKMEAATSSRIFAPTPLIAEAIGLCTAMEFSSNRVSSMLCSKQTIRS